MVSMIAKARADRRGEILAAAQSCFWKSGIRRSSIDDVAREAGLAKGTIYLYFDSKEELFAALAAELCSAALGEVERALAARGSLAHRLAAALDAKIGHFQRLLAGSPHAPELLDSSARFAAASLSALDRAFHSALDKALRDELGLDAARRAELLELILVAGYGTAHRGMERRKLSPAAQRAKLERHVELLLKAVRAQPQRSK
jgi:AcrR family transcriptional regulator